MIKQGEEIVGWIRGLWQGLDWGSEPEEEAQET